MVRTAPRDEPRVDLPGISALAMAESRCTTCRGFGEVWRGPHAGKPGRWRVCGCVWRAAFRACLGKHHYCQSHGMGAVRVVQFERKSQPGGRTLLLRGHRNVEFSVDFLLVARRALAGRAIERAVFDVHCVGGREWRAALAEINRKLGATLPRPLDRGQFFHALYRLQALVGQALVETKPYRLYPLDEYFGGAMLTGGMVPRVRGTGVNTGKAA